MKTNVAFLLFFILLTACSCQPLKYKADLGFLNSAQANSPEYLVKINGKFCKDLDGEMGLCAKRIKSNEKISFILDKRAYSYRLNVSCSSLVNFKLSVDVLENANFEFSIEPEAFQEAKSFTCIGEVFPQDRSESVSAFWHSRFIVVDKLYQGREEIYSQDGALILGSNAKYTLLNEDKIIKKKTAIKADGISKAYSESETMRFNYYGY